ncbi:hypothetical protein JOB18_018989 [Solea senegalensis]|uniref:Uncharacterized protein n=1 Tax=Solea senegalensis TaxID=28829 RepID=A0AAV6PZP4_SOLSE|nr:hypothetical protein JOB18_018989 [Solea senegalensis]
MDKSSRRPRLSFYEVSLLHYEDNRGLRGNKYISSMKVSKATKSAGNRSSRAPIVCEIALQHGCALNSRGLDEQETVILQSRAPPTVSPASIYIPAPRFMTTGILFEYHTKSSGSSPAREREGGLDMIRGNALDVTKDELN